MVKLLKIPEPKSEIPNVFSKNLGGKTPEGRNSKDFLTRDGRFQNPAIDLFVKKVKTMFLPIRRLELHTN